MTEIENSLDEAVKILARRNTLVKTRGKRDGEYVFLLVKPEVQASLNLLIEKRSEMGILEENRFLFPIPAKAKSYLRGSDVIAKFANKCALRDRRSFTSTALRKYLATTLQVSAMLLTESG